MIRCKNLELKLKDRALLTGLNFQFNSGDFIALLGPNGAGKTTLIRLLSGVLKPTSGAVELDGKPLLQYSIRELAKNIAVLPQETQVTHPFSAEEIVAMGLFAKNGSESEVDSAMERCHCLHLKKRMIQTLSGGEKQRVLLARCLVSKPRFLLLDEPNHSLDFKHELELLRILKELNETGVGILCAVHDLAMARELFPKVLFLKEGKSLGFGAMAELWDVNRLEQVFDVPAKYF